LSSVKRCFTVVIKKVNGSFHHQRIVDGIMRGLTGIRDLVYSSKQVDECCSQAEGHEEEEENHGTSVSH
jgi:hypothetical protein